MTTSTVFPRRPSTTPAFVRRIVPVTPPVQKPTLPVEVVPAGLHPINEYDMLRKQYVKQLQSELRQGIRVRKETNVRTMTVKVLAGRKFDRIAVHTDYHKGESNEEVYYFINRYTGEIFGAKSRLAPNLNHFFGLISNTSKWDWSGRSAINKSDDTVREVGRYGQFRHYAPVNKF